MAQKGAAALEPADSRLSILPRTAPAHRRPSPPRVRSRERPRSAGGIAHKSALMMVVLMRPRSSPAELPRTAHEQQQRALPRAWDSSTLLTGLSGDPGAQVFGMTSHPALALRLKGKNYRHEDGGFPWLHLLPSHHPRP